MSYPPNRRCPSCGTRYWAEGDQPCSECEEGERKMGDSGLAREVERNLASAINYHGWDNFSNTPDFELAERVMHYRPVRQRDDDELEREMSINDLLAKAARSARVGEAGAVFAFMAWLTGRKAISGPFSEMHGAAVAAELADAFCKSQGWEIENEDWHELLKPYPSE